MAGQEPRLPSDGFSKGPSYGQLTEAMRQRPPAIVTITVGGSVIEIRPCDLHVLKGGGFSFGGEYVGSNPSVTALEHYVECTTSFEWSMNEGPDAPSKGTYFPRPKCVRHEH